MKIKCTITEFAQMVRACDRGYCQSCALQGLCDKDKGQGIEILVDEIEPKEETETAEADD